jgi:hypothetical protein
VYYDVEGFFKRLFQGKTWTNKALEIYKLSEAQYRINWHIVPPLAEGRCKICMAHRPSTIVNLYCIVPPPLRGHLCRTGHIWGYYSICQFIRYTEEAWSGWPEPPLQAPFFAWFTNFQTISSVDLAANITLLRTKS